MPEVLCQATLECPTQISSKVILSTELRQGQTCTARSADTTYVCICMYMHVYVSICMYSVNLPIAFHFRGARSKMHKRRFFFTSGMACKTPSSERHTKSRRLPRLQATLRRIESAAPLKTCGGHGSEDELREHLNVPGSTPQRLQSCHCWRCCQGILPSNAASNGNINRCHYGGARHARRGCANAAAKINPKPQNPKPQKHEIGCYFII